MKGKLTLARRECYNNQNGEYVMTDCEEEKNMRRCASQALAYYPVLSQQGVRYG